MKQSVVCEYGDILVEICAIINVHTIRFTKLTVNITKRECAQLPLSCRGVCGGSSFTLVVINCWVFFTDTAMESHKDKNVRTSSNNCETIR